MYNEFESLLLKSKGLQELTKSHGLFWIASKWLQHISILPDQCKMSISVQHVFNSIRLVQHIWILSDQCNKSEYHLMSLAFAREIHQSPVNSLHKGPVTQKMFPFDDAIMTYFYHHTTATYFAWSVQHIQNHQWKYNGSMSNLVFSTVPADGLAPLGARPSAGNVMTMSRFFISTDLILTWRFTILSCLWYFLSMTLNMHSQSWP